VRPPPPPPVEVDGAYVQVLAGIAAEHGITHVGIADAQPMLRARTEIERRKSAGLHNEMGFTYRNPERSTDPQRAVADAQSVVVCARPYALPEPAAPDGPHAVVARYAWADHYGPLRVGLRAIAVRLRRDGYRAVAFADDNSLVDRELAYRAGLGWFGKNANILLPGHGSWFVLGSVVTTAPLPPADAVRPDGCGACRACVDACPTGAIVADGVIDGHRCLAWVLQKPGIIPRAMRGAIGARIYGCDDCQTSCPPTVRFTGKAQSPHVGPVTANVDPLAVLEADDEGVLAVWGEWYLANREPRWVRRNALVVLGNSGAGADVRVAQAIGRYIADPDPMLRVHAVWAARTLGLHALVPAHDDDPDVAAEL
jgi:epoxyqueuosine reductase